MKDDAIPAQTPSTAHTLQRPTATLLGGRDVASFLESYWHKQPLLIKGAVPNFTGAFDAARLLALAQRDDVESRLVMRHGARWSLAHGPFKRADWKALPARNWTLLVQGVNLHDRAADALLRRFSFLPYARLDDLMVSYAAPGGGVGPHFDSYDVFLLQGSGRRRWRYGRQADLSLRPNLPVKILRHFTPQHEIVAQPGDMLYLPPHYAHDGVAQDACTTWSIGFRAPSSVELATAFLDFLRDAIDLPGRYADPDLAPTNSPAAIGSAMQKQCARMLSNVRWDEATVARFLGCWLSEPKPTVFFTAPATPLTRIRFARTVAQHGLRLSSSTQLLYDRRHLYINGSAVAWPDAGAATLRRLANRRALTPREAESLPAAITSLLHGWYRDGYILPGST